MSRNADASEPEPSSCEALDLNREVVAEGTILGRYTLWEELGAGGMATVYRATVDGPGKLVRPVALKLVHPHLAKHKTFVSMFLDEARVVSRIVHPNVCGVVDFGEVNDTYFMALEYLEGEPLHELFHEVAGRPSLLSTARWVALASCIVSAACEGLHAAHDLCDERGTSLKVVHRDVSPQNIFVSYSGSVKVMDFGVAYAEGRLSNTTQPGIIKGKYGYVAPEQLAGLIDRRVDVWAAGVCLWELLTGQRLFGAGTAVESISRVATAEIVPPSRFNSAVPPALDEVTMRALARHPDNRYKTARRFARSLDQAVRNLEVPTGLAALSDLMRELFPDRAPKSGREPTSQVFRIGRRVGPDEKTAQAKHPTDPPVLPVQRPLTVETSLPVHRWWKPKWVLVGSLGLLGSWLAIVTSSWMFDEAVTENHQDRLLTAMRSSPTPNDPSSVDRRHHSTAARGAERTGGALVATGTPDAFPRTRLAAPRNPSSQGTERSRPSETGEEAVRPSDRAEERSARSNDRSRDRGQQSEERSALRSNDRSRDDSGQQSEERQGVARRRASRSSDSRVDEILDDDEELSDVRPQRGWGSVNVMTLGSWADVYEHGRLLGRAPLRLRLPAGTHRLRVRAGGNGPERVVRVRVRPGQRRRVVVDLR